MSISPQEELKKDLKRLAELNDTYLRGSMDEYREFHTLNGKYGLEWPMIYDHITTQQAQIDGLLGLATFIHENGHVLSCKEGDECTCGVKQAGELLAALPPQLLADYQHRQAVIQAASEVAHETYSVDEDDWRCHKSIPLKRLYAAVDAFENQKKGE